MWIAFYVSVMLHVFVNFSSGKQANPAHYRVQYRLSDNTPADHLIGNILSGIRLKQNPTRTLLTADSLFRLTTLGDLYTRVALDRDELCGRFRCCETEICSTELEAYIFDSSPTPTSIQITVLFSDENDNAPKFSKLNVDVTGDLNTSCEWTLTVPESAGIGSRYSLPVATDQDSPINGVHRYSILSFQNDSGIMSPIGTTFSIPFTLLTSSDTLATKIPSPLPVLQLEQALDRELKEEYAFILLAEDSGEPPLSSTLKVCVRVQDVNDNPPYFTNNLSFDESHVVIAENTTVGETIYRFIAKDPDDGQNKEIQYSIDWTAANPSWNQTTVQRIGSKFNIHPKTGELRIVNPLDYENEDERRFALLIKATDQGSPKLSTSTSFTISVTDVNDNSPVIEALDVDGVDLSENDAEPKLLKMISISDMDSVSVGKIHCHLSDSYRDDFQLVPYSPLMYGLLNARAFDYEQDVGHHGNMAIQIECVDEAEPQRTGRATINIKLVDLNDNWPQFMESNYHFTVPENVPIGTLIGNIKATDVDFSSKVTYELTAIQSNHRPLMRIDRQTGSVYSSGLLDRESLNVLEFQVTAKDGGETLDNAVGSNIKTNTTSLTISITDVNDNAPLYTGPTTVHIKENIPVGTEILSPILFTDNDLGINGTVSVFLSNSFGLKSNHESTNAIMSKGSSNYAPFSVLENSRLITTGEIDREQHPQIIIKLIATDHGEPNKLSTTVSLTILIDDTNDNYPQLVYPKNSSLLPVLAGDWLTQMTTVPADTTRGTQLAAILARDSDAGENGSVTYHLVPPRFGKSSLELLENSLDGYRYFHIDETSGQLTTDWGERRSPTHTVNHTNPSNVLESRSPMKDNPSPGLYVLNVELRDGGRPSLASRAVFYVNISEAVGGAFGFIFFGAGNMSNTIMLVLIMACSMALIISLLAAIFWVRFRKENHGMDMAPSRSHTNYIGPTVIGHENGTNGYYLETCFSPVMGAPASFCEHQYNNTSYGTLLPYKDQFGSDSKPCNPDHEHCRNSTQYYDAYVGGLVPVYLPDDSELHNQPIPSSDGQTEGMHWTSYPATERYTTPLSNLPFNEPVEWPKSIDAIGMENARGTPPDFKNFSPPDAMGYNQTTNNNNSTCGSDSGVDIGAGVLVPSMCSFATSTPVAFDSRFVIDPPHGPVVFNPSTCTFRPTSSEQYTHGGLLKGCHEGNMLAYPDSIAQNSREPY